MENKVYNEKDYIISSLGEFFGDYTVTTVEEYFKLLDKETIKRSQLVSKSLTKYLNQVKTESKYNKLNRKALA